MGCKTCQILGGNEINLLFLKIVIQIVLHINKSYVSQSVKWRNRAGHNQPQCIGKNKYRAVYL